MSKTALICLISIVVFFTNFIWENAQAVLFKGFVSYGQHFTSCFIATIADVAITLLIYFGFALAYQDFYWLRKFTVKSVLLLAITGFLIGIGIEYWALERNMWSYNSKMPFVPFTQIGLVPVLQFTLLPIVSLYTTHVILKRM